MVYTDIGRDGALTGVNAEATSAIAGKTGMNVIASGGMSSLDDIKELLRKKNVYGAILGRAIYNGNIDLAEALAVAKRG